MSNDLKDFDIDSSAVVAGLSSGLLTYCSKQNESYLKCKSKNQNPEDCLKESMDVRRCAFTLAHEYMDKKNGCSNLFSKYVQCLRDSDYEFKDCYKQRVLFEACAADKIGIQFKDPVNPKVYK